MSLRTRIRGYTAWVNLRLKAKNNALNNVLMDLLLGTNMKVLAESMTGYEMKNVDSFDGISQQQQVTRVEWILRDLKRFKIVPDDVKIDCRLFANRSADHVFELLWRLVVHDIHFVWERADYLQQNDDEVLCQYPFRWVPEPPKIKKKKQKVTKSLLTGFGSSSVNVEELEDNEPDPMDSYEPFPGSEAVKAFKTKRKHMDQYPGAEDCIVDMINAHLKMTNEGRHLLVTSIDDLADSRVLCAIANTFVKHAFTTEILLNDRWTINTVLRTLEEMWFAENPFDSEDLAQADKQAVCSYFLFIFMVGYKFRQSAAVDRQYNYLRQLLRDANSELDEFPEVINNIDELKLKRIAKVKRDEVQQKIDELESKFDIPFCSTWVDHVNKTIKKTHKKIRKHMKDRFITLEVPRNISINDICISMVVNLSLTKGTGFYLATEKEAISDNRKIVLRKRDTHEFIEDFSGKMNVSIRKILQLPSDGTVDINPSHYKNVDIYVEAMSRNKQMKTGTEFLYQIFPGTTSTWQKLYLKAVKDNEIETVQKFVTFFKHSPSFINCREQVTGNTALHIAARLGHLTVARFLLESGANIDAKNAFKYTPLFCAIEGLHREMCHLLIEWGCDVHCKSLRDQTAIESAKSDELKQFLTSLHNHYSTIVPAIMKGDTKLLNRVVMDHKAGIRMFCNLRSRCINGSTLLHTSAYFGDQNTLRQLLLMKVDINLQDYKGATALHRARDIETIKALFDGGAKVDVEDSEGNTPLHVKAYGETDEPTEIECIQFFIKSDASIVSRNNRGLMPIHCAAMQGRIDAMQELLKADKNNEIRENLNEEQLANPPSLVYLAVANGYIPCANWLLSNDFNFKEKEPDVLVQRILTNQIKVKQKFKVIEFLLEHGANPNPEYSDGNSAIHITAGMPDQVDALEVLIHAGADVNSINEEQSTPLFIAMQKNNPQGAAVLIDNGADIRHKNLRGLTAFDFISDYDEWIESIYFTEEIKARLKAYSLKHSRDLIRAISKKVKPKKDAKTTQTQIVEALYFSVFRKK